MAEQDPRANRREAIFPIIGSTLTMLNLHSHTPKGCGDVFCMCAAYLLPCIILLLILLLMVGFNAYFITLSLELNVNWRIGAAVVAMVFGNAASAVLLWAFLGVTLTGAGYVPPIPWKYPPRYVGDRSDFQPSVLAPIEGFNPNSVTQLNYMNRLRYCVPCDQFKPDNAYHCAFCSRCTYEFDHHCPVMNNCIGRNNYKLFVTFLVYAGIVGFLNGGLLLIAIFVLEVGDYNILWLMLPIIMVMVAAPPFCFGLLHVWWVYHGESTMSRHVASFNRERSRQPTRQQLERRRRAHWDAVLGTDRRWWRMILPLKPRWLASEETV
ncbi:zinc finger protein [Trypanosoma rangeli]|uniref:Palmitoyltransferase n=1 Tax=Trypanosoma rangeli TaxID=5698 RepID=A0A3R7MRW9_TRYRA|nr:zinc finger protein [Trypanosoma rangeli]RNF10270.1 zinc finger protein [Trypanosoma rangeli]|eukprot:RNF10270.1 zinc finger protein [Trypanosoma rangeli]